MIDIEKINALADKPSSYKFNKEEFEIIKQYVSSQPNRLKVKYAFYRPKSSKGLYIAFIYDTINDSQRRSGLENKWEIICTRDYNEIELEEHCYNYGRLKNRFLVYYYKDIETLIEEDLKYNINTPKEFIKQATKRGFVRKK